MPAHWQTHCNTTQCRARAVQGGDDRMTWKIAFPQLIDKMSIFPLKLLCPGKLSPMKLKHFSSNIVFEAEMLSRFELG